MVKFLIDENISPKTQQFLIELGFDAVNLKLRGISDEEVVSSN
jgi:predicted nuclease of predicted toxin-antitoxin system